MDNKTKKIALRSVKKVQLYQKVFSGPDGEAVLFDLMTAHGMLHSTFNVDVNQMILKEGERNVVLRILTLLKTNPRKIIERIEANAAEESFDE